MIFLNKAILLALIISNANANVIEIDKYPTNTAFNIVNMSENRNIGTEKYINFYDKYKRYSIENFIKKIRYLDNRINFLIVSPNRLELLNLSNRLVEMKILKKVYILEY